MRIPKSHALIFDLGRVLVTFDHQRCYQKLADLTATTPEQVRTVVEDGIRPRFDRGQMTVDDVRRYLQVRLGGTLARADLVLAWADVFDPVPEMLTWLKSLSKRVRLALLSNTDAIHLPWVEEKFGFLHFFEQRVLSYEVGSIKPEAEIYQAALRALRLPAPACCFIDDISAYAEAARAQGMTAVHHRSPAQTQLLVEEWLATMDRA